MGITREAGGPKGRKRLISGEFIDPRDLGPDNPIRDLARAYLQELRDKGRSELTLPRYERFLSEFLDFVERDGAAPRIRDIDIRTLRAFSSHLARRRRTETGSSTRSRSSAKGAATGGSFSPGAPGNGCRCICERARTKTRRSSSRAARKQAARTAWA